MIRVASSTSSMLNELARTALTMLGAKAPAHEAKPLNGDTPTAFTHGDAAAAPAQTALPPGVGLPVDAPSGISISDWDDLFRAVEARLKMTVGDGLGQPVNLPGNYAAAMVQASVLDCVKALDQLHVALALERGRLQKLELEIIEAKSAHALTLAELVLSQNR
ncbi:hypothetical protein [Polaromonas sp.]|uniref:hypothetical protein n=1 Tax=Polaromonas sp. TaxID=1869339 RepID=UPI00286D4D52|nr:hypothetical protein [Polaromonas sp.]